jgi:hypothetical protein
VIDRQQARLVLHIGPQFSRDLSHGRLVIGRHKMIDLLCIVFYFYA